MKKLELSYIGFILNSLPTFCDKTPSTVYSELYDPISGSWTFTGNLAITHFNHTATLLPNGKVLVVGGYDAIGFASATAELYDPATGTWTTTGSLTTARASHAAILLPNAKVLVAGGGNPSTNFKSAEVYDPNTGLWTPTGNMLTARDVHAATLLPNGKVLIAGGSNASGSLASAELYDPVIGSWASTSSLATDRFNHTLTLLPNGKILAVGGNNNNGSTILVSSELYDIGGGYNNSWRPNILNANSSLTTGVSKLAISGSGFKGVSEASGGATNSSATNYPLVQLRSLTNEQIAWIPVSSWSATDITTTVIGGFPTGNALLTIYTNAIPSQSK